MENNGMEPDRKAVYGIILAAGYSSRMGDFKPLMPIGNMAAVEKVFDTLKKAEIQNLIAVTGYKRELMMPVLEKAQVREAYNPDFDLGMFTSIQAGIRLALSESRGRVEGFFLMLADSPLIPPEVLREILEKHREEPDAFIVPCYRGKKGHPLFIPGIYAKEILTYEGDNGLKGITNKYEDRFIRLEVGDESVVLDMDTKEGYREILDFYQRQVTGTDKSSGRSMQWRELLQGRRLFLVRHGQTRQHKEKIFLGQTDISLSEEGINQARQAGEKLKKYDVLTDRIYTSDLSRAYETAEVIGKILDDFHKATANGFHESQIYYVKDKGLREMSLGEWDGRFISEIKAEYPDEYRKRGENLLAYKYGNESENFFDLQYRVMKSFGGILRLENHESKLLKEKEGGRYLKDIVIVAHSGVMKVLLSNLYDTNLSEELKRSIPNGEIMMIDFTGKEN